MSKWRVDFLNGDKSSGYMIVQASSERLAAKQAKEKDFFVCHVHEVSEDTKIASYINDQEITTNSELASVKKAAFIVIGVLVLVAGVIAYFVR